MREKDRLLAILLFAICTLWAQAIFDKKSYNSLQKELVNRSDSCDIQKIRILQDNISDVYKAKKIVDSIANVNLSIIIKNNKLIKADK